MTVSNPKRNMSNDEYFNLCLHWKASVWQISSLWLCMCIMLF